MLNNTLTLGKLLGVEVRLDWSLLIIALLILTNLGLGVFPQWHPDWSPLLQWGVAGAATVVFFISILLHELAHSVTANAVEVPVKSITLFLFGGVANMEEEPPSAWKEFLIAIVGPVTSLVLGGAMILAVGATLPIDPTTAAEEPVEIMSNLSPLATVFVWVGPINILLALFNMLPAFPLDGGRVLRAALWGLANDITKATRWAAMTTRVISWGLIAIGIAMALGISVPFFGSGLVGGLWLAFIGWFIGRAGRAAYLQLIVRNALTGVTLRSLVRSTSPTIHPDTSLQRASNLFYNERGAGRLPVVDSNGTLVGMLTLDALRNIPTEGRTQRSASSVAESVEDFETLSADSDASEAFQKLIRSGGELIVVDDDQTFVGMLQINDLMHWLSVHGPRLSAGLLPR